MKKEVSFALIIGLLFLWVSPSFSAESILDAEKEKGLLVYNKKGGSVGIVKKINNKLIFYNNDAVTFKKYGKNEWQIYDMRNAYVGKLVRVTDGLRLYNKSNDFTNIVINIKERESQAVNPSARATEPKLTNEYEYVSTIITASLRLTPEASSLYCHVMDALEESSSHAGE